MFIYTVRAGDTLSGIANEFSVPQNFLAIWNSIPPPYELVVGQAILILFPSEVYTVRQGDTVFSIASAFGLTPRDLYALNPQLYGGLVPLSPGQSLVIDFDEIKEYSMFVNAYAYTFIENRILRQTLPYLSSLAPFTYGFTPAGDLIYLDDESLISAAYEYGTLPIMHLSTLTEAGNFSNELASALLSSPEAQNILISQILSAMREKGYTALDIDFEFIFASDGPKYADFISLARRTLSGYGYPVFAALAPKTYAAQPGLLYEGHLYSEIGAAADKVFLMTYEWGYTYGPPMAVAPIGSVRRVLDYAITEIPPDKILMGIPNYAYDWTLPYKSGDTRAKLISNEDAVALARINGVPISYDETAQTPHFNYSDGNSEHEVWFEDARSIEKKLALVPEYGFYGVGYWNAMRPFKQNWMLLNAKYNILTSFL